MASIEMLEAIGERQFPTYFETIDRLLEPGGLACIQTILIPDDRWDRYRKAPDWIERYVFPGCLIPSLTALTQAMTRSSRLMVHEVDEIGPHYAETLRRWREASWRTSTRCEGLGTTSGSSGPGTSISPSARPRSARARSETFS